jgi:microcystin-dependent protein
MFRKKCISEEKGSTTLGVSALAASAVVLGGSVAAPAEVQEIIYQAVGIDVFDDVDAFFPQVGHTLVYDGTQWVSQKVNINNLTDVEASLVPFAQDVLVWDGEKWVNGEAPAPSFASLKDVSVLTPQKGDTVVWDGTRWVGQMGGMVGELVIWSSNSIPDGWLVADGRAASRTTYADLFAAIGTTYGAGDGTTTFNLPDFRGNIAVGRDAGDADFNTVGEVGGEKNVTLTVAQLPSHSHTQQAHSHGGSAAAAGAHTHTGSTDSGIGHTHSGSWTDSATHSHNFSTRNGVQSKYDTPSNVRGVPGNNSSSGGGTHAHSISTSITGAHTHTFTSSTAGEHTHTVTAQSATAVNNNTGGGEAHNNMMPYSVMNYIIKY